MQNSKSITVNRLLSQDSLKNNALERSTTPNTIQVRSEHYINSIEEAGDVITSSIDEITLIPKDSSEALDTLIRAFMPSLTLNSAEI